MTTYGKNLKALGWFLGIVCWLACVGLLGYDCVLLAVNWDVISSTPADGVMNVIMFFLPWTGGAIGALILGFVFKDVLNGFGVIVSKHEGK